MIVKVQTSLNPPAGSLCCVYTKNKKVFFQCDTPPDLKDRMGKSVKKYFNAHLEGTELVIDDEVPAQDW